MTRTSLSVEDVREAVFQAAALPLSRAVTLPPETYIDPGFFAHEAEMVLARGWICLAHVSQLKKPGDYLRLDVLGEPMVVIRGRDGDMRVLSRVCPHRGADILHPVFGGGEEGNEPILVCPYHRWSFEADGALKGCPEMQKAEGFEKADWRLAPFRAEIWHGFVFVNISGDAAPVAELYAGFGDAIAPWSAAEMEVVIELKWDCDFNWKVMVENWIESYHHLGIHHHTLNTSMPAAMTWTEPEQGHFIRCHLPFNEKTRRATEEAAARDAALDGFKPVPGLPVDRQTEWGLYLGLPCFMLLTARDRVIWYRLLPQAEDRCALLTTTLVTKAAMTDPDYAATLEAETRMLRDFHVEDMQVNAAMQAGLRSSKVVRGRLSHLEEPIWHIQRYLSRRLRESEPRRPA
ncbi:aromatic ring-hydroxylating oxygenase subunit alpha [Methylopila sp. Yamaguchi]|uniref:aromatic ring-hydroxylating oxygenase subunit alpha n=1 Tax=Methylopila sp. Yamaguchi TaxID=1437817 RepID=UPI000CB8FBB4|nr:aromatic ring-hydroxylating dioxygenase subunit alpha [Methylopila sp. Yamaguchi]GBD50424.1 Rieske (2Fe-2S) domain-containing protein [Methylopila sp. Yamaguchi]